MTLNVNKFVFIGDFISRCRHIVPRLWFIRVCPFSRRLFQSGRERARRSVSFMVPVAAVARQWTPKLVPERNYSTCLVMSHKFVAYQTCLFNWINLLLAPIQFTRATAFRPTKELLLYFFGVNFVSRWNVLLFIGLKLTWSSLFKQKQRAFRRRLSFSGIFHEIDSINYHN